MLEARDRSGVLATARLRELGQLNLYGNVQVSSQALRELLRRNVSVAYFTSGGWFCGITTAHAHKNIEIRRAQFRIADDPTVCRELARGFVHAKISNCRTLLRRNAREPIPETLRTLARLAKDSLRAESLETLLGVEGSAAREYFSAFHGLLRSKPDFPFDWAGRNRRPPRDPLNALLSFLYSMLSRDLYSAAIACGLDPLLGFYHQPRYGRPALALDLCEEFRPLVADSTALGMINNGELEASDFVTNSLGCSLTAEGRRTVLTAYERRLAQEVQHPLFGYRVSYRKIFELQARLLGRFLTGEVPEYAAFRTR